MRTVLVVAGSRELAKTPGAVAWAHGEIANAVRPLSRNAGHDALVVTGGSPGENPDTWARRTAMRFGVAWREYRLDGTIQDWAPTDTDPEGRLTGMWWVDGLESARKARALGPRTWPLTRNDRMLAAEIQLGGTLRLLGVIAPWSRTHGTAYTADRAELLDAMVQGRVVKSFAAVTRLTCSTELGPGGSRAQ